MKQKNSEVFYKFPLLLMQADGFICPSSGRSLSMTNDQKHVYMVMKIRNTYFKEHYDTQEGISLLCNIHIKTAGRILRDFIKSGIIVAVKVSVGAQPNWKYAEVKDLLLWKKDGATIKQIGTISPKVWVHRKKKGAGEDEFIPF